MADRPSPEAVIRATLVLPATRADFIDPLVAELAADWRREAGDDEISASIYEVLAEDLDRDALLCPPDEHVSLLSALVLERRSRAISVESLQLGLAAARAGDDRSALQAAADALHARHDALLGDARTLDESERRDAMIDALQAVFLEITFVKSGGAMSPRLARAIADASLGDGPEIRLAD